MSTARSPSWKFARPRTHLPSCLTKVMSRTKLLIIASIPGWMPDPWEPVAIAPAIVTHVSEGKFGRAKPDPFRQRITSVNVAPTEGEASEMQVKDDDDAKFVYKNDDDVPPSHEMELQPSPTRRSHTHRKLCISTRVPTSSHTQSGVKEWPDPITRRGADADATHCCNSSMLRGETATACFRCTLPIQFVSMGPMECCTAVGTSDMGRV